MTSERDLQIQSIVQAVRDLPPPDRAAHLNDSCSGDRELRAAVESRLRHSGVHVEFPTATMREADQSMPGFEPAAPRSASRSASEQIGPYRILQRIGEGGMGVVYEAEQDHPRRIVALKVIRPAFATPRMLRRFEFEVQVLGQLEHPGIARIYEAGTDEEDGKRFPFFAMEFIQGSPITLYAQGSGLGVRERLELVARTCDAVHYAHLKGVIHRDIKPANILVQPPGDASASGSGATTAEWNVGQPKVLDFGVARAVDAEVAQQTQHTEAGQLVGTLPYMSPEQVSGDPDAVDVRADVYSLGVVMYESLTQQLPFDLSRRSVLDAARIIREQEPARPSTVNPEFRGDIDTIVLKALAKDPGHRYESAAQLAADIRHYLRDEPITARPASAIYTLRKLARRHKAVVTGITIAALGLVAGTVFATRQAILARIAEGEALQQRDRARDAEFAATQQRDRAARAEADAVDQMKLAMVSKRQADAVNEFLRDMLASVDPERTPNHEITMAEVLDSAAKTIGDRFKDDPPVEIQIRETIGATYSNLGKPAQAAEQMRLVVETASERLGPDDATTHNARTNLALAYRDLDRMPEALELAKQAAEGLKRKAGPDNANTLAAEANVALILLDMGRAEEALPMLESVVARRRATGDHTSQAFLRNVSALASAHNELGESDKAEPLLREALETRLATLSPTHPDVVTSKNNLATLWIQQGKLDQAKTLLEELMKIAPESLGPDHPMVYTIKTNLGAIYDTMGKPDLSQPLFEQTLEFDRRVYGEKHRDTLSAMNNLAGTYRAQGRFDLAEPLFVQVLKSRRETLGDDHPETIASINNLGFLYRSQKRYVDAEPLYAEALQRFTAALGEKHPSTLIAMSNVGTLYNEMNQPARGEPFNEKVYRLSQETMPENHWFRALAMVRYGVSLAGIGRLDEAEHMLLDGRAGLEKSLGADNERTVLAIREIVRLYEQWQKPDEATKWREQLPAAQ